MSESNVKIFKWKKLSVLAALLLQTNLLQAENVLKPWLSWLEKPGRVQACGFEHEGHLFAVLLSDGEVLTAERLAVVLDGQLMEKFSTSWKLQGGDNATLYLEAPSEKLFEAVVKEEGGQFAHSVRRHVPVDSFSGRIRVEIKLWEGDRGGKNSPDNIIGICEFDWPKG